MNRGLRKRHRDSWFIIPILVIILGILIWNDRPIQPNAASADNPAILTLSGEPITAIQSEEIKIEVYAFNERKNKINILLQQPLKSASAQVYSLKEGQKGAWIGNLYGKGEYQFDIPLKADGIMVYDGIKKVEQFTINF